MIEGLSSPAHEGIFSFLEKSPTADSSEYRSEEDRFFWGHPVPSKKKRKE